MLTSSRPFTASSSGGHSSSPSSTYGSMSPASSTSSSSGCPVPLSRLPVGGMATPSSLCSSSVSSSTSTLLGGGAGNQTAATGACTLCWTNQTYSKTRTIRLRRKDTNTSLGFSIRGGWEHGIGFYVSEVQQQSLAAKKGLCPGDQILQINGFPLERVVHEEVVALIRMSSTDLHLRVRSAGIVPQKTRPGEALTWKRLMSAAAAAASGQQGGGGVTSNGHGHHHHCTTTSASSEVSSFIYQRPRSAASDTFTPSSASSCSEEESGHSPGHHCSHHSSDDSDLTCPSSPVLAFTTTTTTPTSYSEKQLYIRCHTPGSSLGCSVVNGPHSCPGIFVQNVKEGKLAAKCGLEVGDQIVKVNNIDVGAIGFDGAITLLKSLTNLSLVVRKGVARHIFECNRDTYHIFGSSKECHFNHSAGSKTLVKSPSESTLYSSTTQLNPTPAYAYYHAHHQSYKTIQTKCSGAGGSSTTVPLADSNGHYCTAAAATSASFSTVQISAANGGSGSQSCDKARCCCKRQRTITGSPESPPIIYEPCGVPIAGPGQATAPSSAPILASTCSTCTLVMQASANAHHHHQVATSVLPPPPPPHSLFTTDPAHLDQVTSAMANSIRILREVREKEEKLVEASRMLSEEHQKLCREKEKLKLYELEKPPDHHRKTTPTTSSNTIPTPPVFDSECLSINSSSAYSTLSTAPLGSGTLAASRTTKGPPGHPPVGPTFSFLEEIKALGENGTKRHLRPVNSTDTLGSRGGSGTAEKNSEEGGNMDTKSKLLRRLPFGAANGNSTGSSNSKEAETKQRQHELLMEEFRIAHQRMFGGKENKGGSRVDHADSETKSEVMESKNTESTNAPSPPQQQLTKVVSSAVPSRRVQPETGGGSKSKENPAPPPLHIMPPLRCSLAPSKAKETVTESMNGSCSAPGPINPVNRITIKVLSPKLGT